MKSLSVNGAFTADEFTARACQCRSCLSGNSDDINVQIGDEIYLYVSRADLRHVRHVIDEAIERAR